jgi:hypothetical protein
MTAAMTDHIQNNPFGRSTDRHRDDWPAVQIGGYRATAATNGGHAARSSFLAKGQLGAHLDGDGHEGHE